MSFRSSRRHHPQLRKEARVLPFSQRNVERPVWHGGMDDSRTSLSIDDIRMLAPRRQSGSRAPRLGRQLHSTARERFGLTRLLNSESIRVDGWQRILQVAGLAEHPATRRQAAWQRWHTWRSRWHNGVT